MGLRQSAVHRSLDNITILILGLKGLKKTIKQLNQGVSLEQIRSKYCQEYKRTKAKVEKDFFEVELNDNSAAPTDDSALQLQNEETDAIPLSPKENKLSAEQE